MYKPLPVVVNDNVSVSHSIYKPFIDIGDFTSRQTQQASV